MARLKINKAAAVRRVSCQLNAPAPKITRTICARKTKIKTAAGTVQKIMCRNAAEKCSANSSLAFLIEKATKLGKAATLYESPITVTGMYSKFSAKLKTAMLPCEKKDAIPVRTTVVI